MVDVFEFLNYLEDTKDSEWCINVVRSGDGKSNCLFGHLFNFAEKKGLNGSDTWEWFECAYSTTYAVYPVNDGENPMYQQPTPKLRCIQYLKNLVLGREETTLEYMDRKMTEYMEENANESPKN